MRDGHYALTARGKATWTKVFGGQGESVPLMLAANLVTTDAVRERYYGMVQRGRPGDSLRTARRAARQRCIGNPDEY